MSNPFDDPFLRRNALADLLSPSPLSNPLTGYAASDLFGPLSEPYRRRSEWNDRFAHWERSESNAETQRIERARNTVQQALGKNRWLNSEGATRIVPQGSFTNRTNTRLDADIDLRVQHPSIKIEYAHTAWMWQPHINKTAITKSHSATHPTVCEPKSEAS